MGLRFGLVLVALVLVGLVLFGLVLGVSTNALAAEDRLALAKPASGGATPALRPPTLRPYKGKLHIQPGLNAPRLKMAPSTPVAPIKPVRVKPAKK
jgi:hypothetical protein